MVSISKMCERCTDRDHIWHAFAYSSENGHGLNKLAPRFPTGMGVRGSSIHRSGKASNPLDRSAQLWYTYTYSQGNGHGLKQLTPLAPRGIWRGSGGHKFKNVGNKPKSWTDLEHIWNTYEYSSGNGHELTKITT